jgi:hypothetical protein
MNILNNGRFGMVAGLSGTMKMAIRKSIVCISIEKIYEKTNMYLIGFREKSSSIWSYN